MSTTYVTLTTLAIGPNLRPHKEASRSALAPDTIRPIVLVVLYQLAYQRIKIQILHPNLYLNEEVLITAGKSSFRASRIPIPGHSLSSSQRAPANWRMNLSTSALRHLH